MSRYKGNERRRTGRANLVTFCPTQFTHGMHQHEAHMVDVSALGAGFRLDSARDDLALKSGDVLGMVVRTAYGPSDCRGRVVWARRTDDAYTWGVEFTELSKDQKDPLRCLMDSSF